MYQLQLGFTAFFSVVMTGVMIILYRTYPASIMGLKDWCLGSITWSISALLYLGRETLPFFTTVLVANCLFVSGISFIWGC